MSIQKLKRDYVTCGWEGNDMEIIEFPVEVAVLGLFLQIEAREQYPNDLLTEQCLDTIEADENGERMMLIAPMWKFCVDHIKSLEKTIER